MARILDFADGFESSSQPDQGLLLASAIKEFVDNAAFELDKGAASSGGDAYINTTSGFLQLYTGAAWSSYVNASDAQTISGVKTFSDDMNVSGNVIITQNLTVNGTTTSVNSTVLEVVDAQITVNKGGTQASADLQDAGFKVEMSDATDAGVGYDSSLTSKFMAGEEGSQHEVATLGHVQTMTGKTLTGPTVNGGAINSSDVDFSSASNSSRITMPKDTKANLDILTRKQASILYASDEDKHYSDNGVGLDAVVTESRSQSVSNKSITLSDIDGGTATDSSRVTVGKEDKTALDALTRKAATIVFADNENTFYGDTGAALVPFATAAALDSEVFVSAPTGSGHGSTGTRVRVYSTSSVTGTDLTYNSDSVNGDFITVNTAGVYAVMTQDQSSASSYEHGVGLNTSGKTTTNYTVLTPMTEGLVGGTTHQDTTSYMSLTLSFSVAAQIRIHTDTAVNNANTASFLRVVRIR